MGEDITKVSELIDGDRRKWDEVLISRLFNPSEAKSIYSIPICSTRRGDKLVWHHSKDGKYQVKSGYKISKNLKECSDHTSSSSHRNRRIWKWLWALSVPTKNKVFLWRVCHNIIPTKLALAKRGVGLNPMCQRCGLDFETMEHAFRDCSWVEFFWAASPLRIRLPTIERRGSLTDWIERLAERKDPDSDNMVAMLLWSVWWARNELVFKGRTIEHHQLYTQATSRLEEHHQSAVLLSHENKMKANEVWSPPAHGYVKINSDASIMTDEGAGMGVVIRDDRGIVIETSYRFQPNLFDVEVAEALACRNGIFLARSLGLKCVMVEMDNQTLFRKLSRGDNDLSYLGYLVNDICDLFSSFDSIRPCLVRRSGNTVAHLSARCSFSESSLEPMWRTVLFWRCSPN
ncbi:hypothetical protein DH2020_013017 [Rehmannia glutinosa]|uniref:Reverse transcriptase n=1 Tax=Rehmannia glutinosa TaxID=99300 RepID=A0ABR0X287_REHGL